MLTEAEEYRYTLQAHTLQQQQHGGWVMGQVGPMETRPLTRLEESWQGMEIGEAAKKRPMARASTFRHMHASMHLRMHTSTLRAVWRCIQSCTNTQKLRSQINTSRFILFLCLRFFFTAC